VRAVFIVNLLFRWLSTGQTGQRLPELRSGDDFPGGNAKDNTAGEEGDAIRIFYGISAAAAFPDAERPQFRF
jgi:hypothetical protein